MNRLEADFQHWLLSQSRRVLRRDLISKIDSTDELISEVYCLLGNHLARRFVGLSIFEEEDNGWNDLLNHDGRPYRIGKIKLTERIHLLIFVDPNIRNQELRYWLTDDMSLVYTQDAYIIPSHLAVLFH